MEKGGASLLDQNLKGKVFFTRHGECLANVEKRIIGNHETPLTRKGIEQAHQIGAKLSEVNLDFIISSPLSRALETAQIVSTYSPPKKLLTSQRFRPQSFGILEGYTREEAIQAGLEKYLHQTNTNKFTHFVPEGETAQEAMERIVPMFLLIDKLVKDENYTVLLVLHNSVIRSIAAGVWKIPSEKWVSITVPNCEVFQILNEQPLNFQSLFLNTLARAS